MNDSDTYRGTLLYALAIAGSERKLAVHLNVTVHKLQDWLSGADFIPEKAFQAALDLVIGSSRREIFRSRFALQRLAK